MAEGSRGRLARFGRWLSEYRWPVFIVAILGTSIIAQGTMVYFATRPEAPMAEERFYERSLEWDADRAVAESSRRLGWSVSFAVPSGPEYVAGMVQPVDVTIADREGRPVTGLVGRLLAARPSDSRANNAGDLTELPHAPGTYRALVRIPLDGLWELSIDARQGGLRFVYEERVDIRHDPLGGDPASDAARAAPAAGEGEGERAG